MTGVPRHLNNNANIYFSRLDVCEPLSFKSKFCRGIACYSLPTQPVRVRPASSETHNQVPGWGEVGIKRIGVISLPSSRSTSHTPLSP